jgi:class 3 adenylate cyclase
VQIPPTHYAQSGELAIAYQVHGAGEHDLLFSGSTASNVETVWMLPEAAVLFERLGRFARVIRFDRRDSGCSDPIKDDLTLEAHAADALAVMDAAGASRPVLMGALDGARSLAALAATRPERVASMIAVSPTARGMAQAAPEVLTEVMDALAQLEWPGPIIDMVAPEWAADAERRDLLRRYIQTSSTPRQGARQLRLSLTSDVTAVLPLIQAPTLVLQPRDTSLVPADAVREFADLIPQATYREIPGSALLPYALDTKMFGDVIEEFVTGTVPAPVSSRVLATVLFTDLVGSTALAAKLGDRPWAELLGRHHDAVRGAVAAHGGETVKTLGDGVLALFPGPAQGVRCAQRAAQDADSLGLAVRSGLHTGEVERAGDDVSGLAVHLAARIMALAGGGEVLVSRTVRDLVIGSELSFEDRGEHELKGVPERWAVFAAGG